MKKKLVAVLMATAMVFSMCSCGGSSDTNATKSEKKEDQEKKKEESKKEEEKKTLESFSGKPVSDFMSKVSELGYQATYSDEGVDFTEMVSDLQSDYCVDKADVDTESKKVSVELVSNTELQNRKVKESLEKKLPASNCWVAAKNYGEQQYPYGFELHYFMGKIAEQPQDENTWFLKAECTVTNMFGVEVDGTCEATVTGSQENPQVTSFNVY